MDSISQFSWWSISQTFIWNFLNSFFREGPQESNHVPPCSERWQKMFDIFIEEELGGGFFTMKKMTLRKRFSQEKIKIYVKTLFESFYKFQKAITNLKPKDMLYTSHLSQSNNHLNQTFWYSAWANIFTLHLRKQTKTSIACA